MDIDHVYVLNVPTETKRKTHMKNILINEGLVEHKDFTILEGVDGRKISKLEAQKYNEKRLKYYSINGYTTKPLTRGQIGCIQSHLLAYKNIIYNNYNCCLILEDDAKFKKPFKEIKNCLKSFEHWEDFDYMLLHRKCPDLCMKARGWPFVKNWFMTPNNDEKLAKNEHKMFIRAGLSYGTNSQLVTKSGAVKLLKWCETIYDPMDIQIHMMNYSTNVFTGIYEPLKMYATTEPFTEPAGFGSLTQRIR